MAEQAFRPSTVSTEPGRGRRWRTVDIVVAAVLGVAFGVVFWAWNFLGGLAVPPLSGLLNGVYLMPGVVPGLLIRNPGPAVFASTLAAAVSPLVGSPYGGVLPALRPLPCVGAGPLASPAPRPDRSFA